jgi:Fe-S oxidoreductase
MGDYARRPVRDTAQHHQARSPTTTSKCRPATTREKTFCCGGGGGLLTDELIDLRVKGALPRMEALKQRSSDQQGVNFMATICAICKAQFTKVLPYYKFNR